MKKYFALSDIHGAAISIDDFIAKGFEPNNDNHYIVLMGDYFDRREGNMYEVLQFLEYVQETYPTRSSLIIGNHDEMLLNILEQIDNLSERHGVYASKLDLDLYYMNGGRPTLRELIGGVTIAAEYTLAKEKRVKRLIRLIRSFEPYFETDKYIFAHAGIDENRNINTWDRDMIKYENPTDKTIILGHTTFFHLGGEAVINDEYTISKSSRLDNNIYLIDNGSGQNITIWEEE